MSEVQVLGSLADEYLERIIRRVLEEARARGRDELTADPLPLSAVKRASKRLTISAAYTARYRAELSFGRACR